MRLSRLPDLFSAVCGVNLLAVLAGFLEGRTIRVDRCVWMRMVPDPRGVESAPLLNMIDVGGL